MGEFSSKVTSYSQERWLGVLFCQMFLEVCLCITHTKRLTTEAHAIYAASTAAARMQYLALTTVEFTGTTDPTELRQCAIESDHVVNVDEATIEEEVEKRLGLACLAEDIRGRCEYSAHIAALSALWSIERITARDAVS